MAFIGVSHESFELHALLGTGHVCVTLLDEREESGIELNRGSPLPVALVLRRHHHRCRHRQNSDQGRLFGVVDPGAAHTRFLDDRPLDRVVRGTRLSVSRTWI